VTLSPGRPPAGRAILFITDRKGTALPGDDESVFEQKVVLPGVANFVRNHAGAAGVELSIRDFQDLRLGQWLQCVNLSA
jgi:hypothetical protein